MSESVQVPLLRSLARIDRPGTFCASGRLPATFPGLKVEGVGPVALPLEKAQATALKKAAHQAPYGKGTETVVDTKVRRVWEIDAEHVKLTNPEWAAILVDAVKAAKTELGLDRQKLSAHLYKLLLYEKGSFFLPHRDGEKLDRMVATLIIALPSEHKGGELVVRHDGREQVVNFAPDSSFQTQFAAFYADCEHEVRPVTEGFRLALVYNLTLEATKAKSKSKATIKAPRNSDHVAEITPLLAAWARERQTSRAREDGESDPSKLAILLDHKYSKAGLTYETLKGADRARADVLFAAAREAGCDASLALVTYWESGAAEGEDDFGYGYGRRRWYNRYDEKEDTDSGSEHVMGEVYDTSLTAEQFSDAEGKPLAYGEIPLKESEIVSDEAIKDRDPDEEDYEGYTGNAGMTLDRWYHRAAVMVWPTAWRFDVLCEAGVEAAVGGLEPMVLRWEKAGKAEKAALKPECQEFAGRIIANWPERKRAGDRQSPSYRRRSLADYGMAPAEKKQPRSLLALVGDLADVSLISAWIRGVLARDATANPGEVLGTLLRKHGWAAFRDDLTALYQETTRETLERHAELLADWSLREDDNEARLELCSELAGELVRFVEGWKPDKGNDWQARTVDLRRLLKSLLESLVALGKEDLLDRLVTYVLDRPKDFNLTSVQVPTLIDTDSWLRKRVNRPSPALHRWQTAVVEELERRKAEPPKEPSDWRRGSETGCRCEDCKTLRQFLDDPTTGTLRLPLAKARRQHLHGIIDSNALDTTHVTEHRGSPHVLVLTKTKASYARALAAYRVDLEQLEKARSLVEWAESIASPKAGAKKGRSTKATKKKPG
ncbi:2OG-Fe(II) oxygenase [Aquisphaera insulae]|uniref:2OG-Fe(II) oxygenase n=1 Tax=Aquisphaera insulae TaxID=2712864 RepID=UPI0013EB5110|nr:2OG-Fe(II) oxygenase [Aquisphaera insulae]